MEQLRKALEIFAKYTSDEYPTSCEHNQLYVLVDPANVSKEDIAALNELGFIADEDEGNFYSFKYGSA